MRALRVVGRSCVRRVHGADAREQLAEPERLDDVVVRAELEADAPGRSPRPCAVTMMIGTAERLRSSRAHREAVGVRKADVEQHEVRLRRLERRRSGRDPLDLEPLAAQTLHERLRDRVLVLDDQKLHAAKARRVRGWPDRGKAAGPISESPDPLSHL